MPVLFVLSRVETFLIYDGFSALIYTRPKLMALLCTFFSNIVAVLGQKTNQDDLHSFILCRLCALCVLPVPGVLGKETGQPARVGTSNQDQGMGSVHIW